MYDVCLHLDALLEEAITFGTKQQNQTDQAQMIRVASAVVVPMPVCNKARRLKVDDAFDKLDKNNEGNNVKEKRITTLEKAIDSLRSEAASQEEKITALKADVKIMNDKYKLEMEEKEFFHK